MNKQFLNCANNLRLIYCNIIFLIVSFRCFCNQFEFHNFDIFRYPIANIPLAGKKRTLHHILFTSCDLHSFSLTKISSTIYVMQDEFFVVKAFCTFFKCHIGCIADIVWWNFFQTQTTLADSILFLVIKDITVKRRILLYTWQL